MKKTLLMVAISILLMVKESAAQKQFAAIPVTNQSAQSLSSHFTSYSLFRINTAAIKSFAKEQTGKTINFELQLPGYTNWKFSIAEHDILSKNYTLTVNGQDGRTMLPKPACMTYAGYLADVGESRVSLTLDNNIIYGMIRNKDKEYFIEPLTYFNKQASPDVFVVYNTKDVVTDPNISCGVTEMAQHQGVAQRGESGTNCVQTQLAIASDQSMFARYGSASAVQTHNIGVMNNVIWDYVNDQFTDNIEFVIVGQNVSTAVGNDQLSPAYTGTDANTILPNFRTWGEAGNFGLTYDIAQFWTSRDIDNDGAGGNAGIIGLAYVGAVCGTFRYHILEDYYGSNPSGSGFQLRVLTAHEIGHNFNCVHDASGSGFIMAPSVSSTTTWSPTSISAVNSFEPGLGCLSACSLAGTPIANFITTPDAICTGNTFQLIDHSLQGPTSWSWTMSGGTPASSTVRNPTVSYSTNGLKTVTLTSSNGGGAGSPVSKNILVSSGAAAACVNSGANGSNAGITLFSLNNINKNSGSAAVDGDRYMDFSCSNITNLVAGTKYLVSVTVGATSPNVFNHVLLYIDYNNDGDFNDAGENVYSSGGTGYIGTDTFSITTPSSPLVTDQLLRARVIAQDFGGPAIPCANPSAGQVEDYSVFFASNIVLPVSLLKFDGYYQNGKTILNWQTANEKDNSYFEIERSTDGIHFTGTDQVNSLVNNSSSVTQYSYTDPLTGLTGYSRIYYRLKIVDLSGAFTYSKIVPITIKSGKNELLLMLYPNPFADAITTTIQLTKSSNIMMQLTDIAGRIVYTDNRSLPAGIHTLAYNNFDNLTKGTYVIKLTCDNEIVTRLIEKQ